MNGKRKLELLVKFFEVELSIVKKCVYSQIALGLKKKVLVELQLV